MMPAPSGALQFRAPGQLILASWIGLPLNPKPETLVYGAFRPRNKEPRLRRKTCAMVSVNFAC